MFRECSGRALPTAMVAELDASASPQQGGRRRFHPGRRPRTAESASATPSRRRRLPRRPRPMVHRPRGRAERIAVGPPDAQREEPLAAADRAHYHKGSNRDLLVFFSARRGLPDLALDGSRAGSLPELRRRRRPAAAGLGAVVFAAAGGWLLRLAGARPIASMTHAAAEISERNLQNRLDVATAPSEMQDLAATINGAFDRLEDAFGRLRSSRPTPRTSCGLRWRSRRRTCSWPSRASARRRTIARRSRRAVRRSIAWVGWSSRCSPRAARRRNRSPSAGPVPTSHKLAGEAVELCGRWPTSTTRSSPDPTHSRAPASAADSGERRSGCCG